MLKSGKDTHGDGCQSILGDSNQGRIPFAESSSAEPPQSGTTEADSSGRGRLFLSTSRFRIPGRCPVRAPGRGNPAICRML